MKNQITHLHIENFKSIKSIDLDCRRINVFVGRPNVGKSNILEALSLYSAQYSTRYDKFLSEFIRYENFSNLFYDNDRSKNIEVSSNIGFAAIRYHFGIERYDLTTGKEKEILDVLDLKTNLKDLVDRFEEVVREKYSNDNQYFYKIINQNGSVDATIINSLLPVKKYQFDKDAKINDTYSAFLKPPFGENLVVMIELFPELRKEIPALFKEYGLEVVLDVQEKKLDIQKRVEDFVYKIPYSLMADTLQRIIFHLAAIYTNKDSVLLFEEPEAHSFPPYIAMLAREIADSMDNQFFIATHSPYILNTFLQDVKEDDLAIFLCYYEDYQTKVKQLSEKEIGQLMDTGADLFFNMEAYMPND